MVGGQGRGGAPRHPLSNEDPDILFEVTGGTAPVSGDSLPVGRQRG